MDPILTEENYDTAVVHVGVNDMCQLDKSGKFGIKFGKNSVKTETI